VFVAIAVDDACLSPRRSSQVKGLEFIDIEQDE
jgi:hypothetical protein